MFKNLINIITVLLIVNGSLVTTAFAVSSSFEINLQVITNDVDAPSIPTGLLATGVSISQIDVSWNASTDNVGVAGYHLYRDDILIATTTLTSYSDIGLLESTSYAYTVSAFDAASNESATSSVAVGTTLTTPPPTPVSTSTDPIIGNGPILEDSTPEFSNFSIVPEQTSAEIYWNTSLLSQTEIRWGRTPDYELGSLSNPLVESDHNIFLSDLLPHTRYYLEVTVTDGVFRKSNTVRTSFTTLGLPDTTPAANISNLRGIYNEREISLTLTWSNPSDADFEAVRVLRSPRFYPTSLYDGEVLYDGSGELFTDRTIEEGKTYYYTLFARDASKNYSSGVVYAFTTPVSVEGNIPEEGGEFVLDPIHSFPKVENPDPAFEFLSLKDFAFIQEGVKRTIVGNTVSVHSQKQLTISLPYNAVPEVLKTIAVTLVHPTDRRNTFTFLLRVDKEKTEYTATIDALKENGNYSVYITMLDFEQKRLTTLTGNFAVEGRADSEVPLVTSIVRLLILVLLILFVLFIISRYLTRNERA